MRREGGEVLDYDEYFALLRAREAPAPSFRVRLGLALVRLGPHMAGFGQLQDQVPGMSDEASAGLEYPLLQARELWMASGSNEPAQEDPRNLKPAYVHELCRAGRIPATKSGKYWMIPMRALANFAKNLLSRQGFEPWTP